MLFVCPIAPGQTDVPAGSAHHVESKVYLLVNRLTGAIDSAAHEALAATVTPDSGTGDHNLPQLGEQQRNPCMFYGESFLFHVPPNIADRSGSHSHARYTPECDLSH